MLKPMRKVDKRTCQAYENSGDKHTDTPTNGWRKQVHGESRSPPCDVWRGVKGRSARRQWCVRKVTSGDDGEQSSIENFER